MRALVENLDTDSGLVREWCSKGCINHQQCRDIEQTLPQFKRNRKLLNILLNRSVADYDVFVDCLKNNSQEHLAELLEISKSEYLIRFR
jgi:Caspase recruitment domain